MVYYKAVLSGRIFPEHKLRILDDIFGEGSLKSWIGLGSLVPVKSVSVIDFLKYGDRVDATRFYKDIHKCTIKEAYDQVKRIEADMIRFGKK